MASRPHNTDDTRDRLIALEVKVDHLTERLDSYGDKITEMHNLLQSAKGAKWLLLTLVALGGFIAAKISPIIAVFFPPK